MNGVIKMHQEELNALTKTISMKQKTISESENNLTTIGTYVDRLEERLTSFAITRRDMEEREKKCKEIEEAAVVTDTERKALQVKVEESTKEQDEIKKVLEELATERATLQKDNRKLLTEREFRLGEQESLQEKCASLETDTKSLSAEMMVWKEKCEALAPALDAAEESNLVFRSRVDNLGDVEKELEAIRAKSAELQVGYEASQRELASVKEERERLEALVNKTKPAESRDEAEATEDDGQSRPPSSPSGRIPNRDVPFRDIRKKLSKVTGIHGLVTPSSKGVKMITTGSFSLPKRQQRPQLPHAPKFSGGMPKGGRPGPPPVPSERPGPPPLQQDRGERPGPPPLKQNRGERPGPPPLQQERGEQSGPPPPQQERGEQSGPPPPQQEHGEQSGPPPPPQQEHGEQSGPPPLSKEQDDLFSA
jgi:hypothetical protein